MMCEIVSLRTTMRGEIANVFGILEVTGKHTKIPEMKLRHLIH